MNMKISGLTPQQAELCEILWQLDGVEEVAEFLATLSPDQLLQARAMMMLLLAEYIDSLELGDCAQAREVCERIRQL